MKTNLYTVLIIVFFSIGCQAENGFTIIQQDRNPAVSGQFYPADKTKLTNAVKSYLDDAVKMNLNKPSAIISPHAGYIFSGQIAADAFNQVKDFDYDVIVIVGTNHTTAGFSKVSVYSKGAFLTPLGRAEIDEDLAGELIASNQDCVFNKDVHTNEHSVEVQIPFIQYLFPDVKIIPVVIGRPDFDMCIEFGKTLGKVLKDKNAFIVASSDLSHYPLYEGAIEVDKKTLAAIADFDTEKVYKVIEENIDKNISGLSTCACGEGPIIAVMTAAKELGANCANVISYMNSGDVSLGDRNRVVGYGSVAFSNEGDCKKNKEALKDISFNNNVELNEENKKALFKFARKTIKQYLTSQTIPVARNFDNSLYAKRGAFVTINKNGQLRGCIGHMKEDMPLCQVIGAMALQAAFNDRRFQPLSVSEFEDIELEISVLTPFAQVESYKDIVVGHDGVLMTKDGLSAVFLPQVAPEQGWDRKEMLDNLSQKAGLGYGNWEGAKFYTFQSNVFHETDVK